MPLLFQNLTDLQSVLGIKANIVLAKNPEIPTIKNLTSTKKVKIKCTIDKRTILFQFFAMFSKKHLTIEIYFINYFITYLQ